MPKIYPFAAIQFQHGKGDVSALISPPYDVLDSAAKRELLDRNPRNIVAIDLPHTPAKELGPPSVYEAAGETYRRWLKEGVLSAGPGPAMYGYRQTTRTELGSTARCGMAVCVDVVPFGPRAGGGVLPHEETFSGPKEDRMALMKSTRAQLSPIFGLHADDRGLATALLHRVIGSRTPDLTGTTGEGVLHEVWRIDDAQTIQAYQQALAGEDVFIADGHHRYTTQLNYVKGLEANGPLDVAHPARRCMMVLVGMSDPGLLIWPTHRVLGGMKDYSIERFMDCSEGQLRFQPNEGTLEQIDAALERAGELGDMRFGVHDCSTGRQFLAAPKTPDPLQSRFPTKPPAWRQLVVAYLQYGVVEQVCQAKLNGGQPVKWAFPHTIREVREIASGKETGAGGGHGFAQVALIVRPTPLGAVRDISRANELMPQKSTFFYPKLATGLFVNALE